MALGCQRIEAAGSRVRFMKDNVLLMVHRPHPGKQAKPYQIDACKKFLSRLELRP